MEKCDNCGSVIGNLETPHVWNSRIVCGSCHGRLSQAVPVLPVNYAVASNSRSGIRIPMLISAIGNIIVGLVWLTTCFGIILTVPMVLLCIFEFLLYARADDLPENELASKAQVMGILEIVVGLFNLISLVCGILVLIHANKLRSRMQPWS